MISQFRIRNYKALRDVRLDLTPMHVLIGPNDSGKTSVLEALQILSRTLDRRLADAIPKRPPEQLFSFGNTAAAMVLGASVTRDAVPATTYSLELSRTGDHWDRVDLLSVGGCPETQLTGNDPTNYSAAFYWLQKGELRLHSQEPDTATTEDLYAGLKTVEQSIRGIQFYRWTPRFLASPAALNDNRRYRMEESGFGLPTFLDDIHGYDDENFGKLRAKFTEIFPEVERIILRQEPGYKEQPTSSTKGPDTSGKGLAIKLKHIDKPLGAASVSDGYLLILAYLALMYSPEPPPVLLIEEPENGIHPRRLEDVIKMLRALTEQEGGPQIIMTTHSPYLVDLFSPEEVTLCLKGDDGAVTTHRLSESELVRKQMGIFTLGEVWSGQGEEDIAKDIEEQKTHS